MMRKGVAWALLALLTVGGLLSVYQLLFSAWMTAYPHVDIGAWRVRFYERLAITTAIGFFWSIVAVWLYRQRQRMEAASEP